MEAIDYLLERTPELTERIVRLEERCDVFNSFISDLMTRVEALEKFHEKNGWKP